MTQKLTIIDQKINPVDIDPQSEKRAILTETITIAVLTFVGYLSAFVYQQSYLGFFGIPYYFIDIGVTNVLLTSFSALSYLFVALMIFESCLRAKIDNEKYPYLRNALIMAVLLLLTEGPLLVLSYDPSDPLRFIKLLLLSLMLVIVYWFLFKKEIARTKEKNEIKKRDEHQKKGLIDHARIRYGVSPILLIILCSFFIAGSYAYGTFVAKNQKEYLVTGTDPTLAIVSTFSGNFVGVVINKKDQSFDSTITLLNKDDIYSKNTYFKNEKIGYLHKLSPSCNIFSNPFEKVFGFCH